MTFRPGPTSRAAWCRLGALAVTALALAGVPSWAATGAANASASVVQAVPIGLPASALDLYLQRLNPGGPFIGSVLVRVIGGIGDEPVALELPSHAAVPAEASLVLEGGPAMLGRGLAMAVEARMSKEQAREDQPVAITIAFN